jgi:hypothetical protein
MFEKNKNESENGGNAESNGAVEDKKLCGVRGISKVPGKID